MADDLSYYGFDPNDPTQTDDPAVNQTGISLLTDPAKALGAGLANLAAVPASVGQYASEQSGAPNAADFFGGLSDIAHATSDAISGSISPSGQRAASAALFPTDPSQASVFEHPFDSFVMKAAGMTPQLGAMMLFPEGLVAQGLAGGAMQAGQVIDNAISGTNKLDDSELQQQSPAYAHYRQTMDEQDARKQLHEDQLSAKDIATAGVVGAAGMGLLGKVMKGGALGTEGAGILKRAGVGAAEGALGTGIAGADIGYEEQKSNVAYGKQNDVDWHQVLAQGLNASLEGGVIGAGAGAIHRGAPAADKPVEIADAAGGGADENAALSSELPQGDTQSAQQPQPDVTQQVTTPEPVAPAAEATPAATPAAAEIPTPATPAPPAAAQAAIRVSKARGRGKTVPTPDTPINPETPTAGESNVPQSIPAPPVAADVGNVEAGGGTAAVDAVAPVAEPTGEAGSAPAAGNTEEAAPQARTQEPAPEAPAAPAQEPVVAQAQEPAQTPEVVGTSSFASVGKAGSAIVDNMYGALWKKVQAGDVKENGQTSSLLLAAKAVRDRGGMKSIDDLRNLANDYANNVTHGDDDFQQQMKDLVYRHAPPEAPKGPRILRPVGEEDEGWVTPQGMREAPKAEQELDENGKPIPKGKNQPARVKAREANGAKAQALIDKHVPGEPTFEKTVGFKQKLKARLQGMLDEAKEQEVKIPQAVRAEAPDPVAYMAQARTMLSKLKNNKATYDDVQQFVSDEHAAKNGDFQPLRQRRLEEGAAKKAPLAKAEPVAGGTSEGADEETNAPSQRARVETPTSEGPASEVRSVKASDEEKARIIAELARAQERQKRAAGGWHAIDRGNGRELSDDELRDALERESQPEPDAPADTTTHVYPLPDGGEVRIHALATHRLGDVLDRLPQRRVTGIAKVIDNFMRRKVKDIAGDTPVHFITNEELRRLGEPNAAGIYHAHAHIIAIPERTLDDPEEFMHTLVHEGVHAATMKGLFGSKDAQRRIQRIMQELDAFHGRQDPSVHYGMTNVAEFLAEASSNPRFQKLLASTPISRELARDLDLPEFKKHSLWRGLVETIRQVLGMPKGSHTALDAALNMTEQASWARNPRDQIGFENNWLDEQSRGFQARRRDEAARENENDLFRESMKDAITRSGNNAKAVAQNFAKNPAERLKAMADHIGDNPNIGARARQLGRYLSTNDQFRQRVEKFFSGVREENVIRQVFDGIEKQGSRARSLKGEGDDLLGAMMRSQKQLPGAFGKFSDLVNDSTMHGIDPSSELGAGRNAHIQLSKENQAKLARGTLKPSDLPFAEWEARAAHPDLRKRYRELVAAHPDFKPLLDRTFNYFKEAQAAMTQGHLENVLNAVGYKGDAASRVRDLIAAKPNDELRESLEKEFGKPVSDQIFAAKKLSGREGVYAPLMRHGDWVVTGRYKVADPTHPDFIGKEGDDAYQFKSREAAHEFAQSTGLHYSADTAYYDPATGERTTKMGGVSQTGNAEQRIEVRLQRRHVEFHPTKRSAELSRRALEASGEFDRLSSAEAKNENGNFKQELTARSIRTIMDKLEAQDDYQRSSPTQKAEMRRALQEASLSQVAGQHVQSRRLPRRRVEGASNDLIRNMAEYNVSQANYRARLEYRPQVDAALDRMHKETEANRYDQHGSMRSEIAAEVERRARAPNPEDYTGAYSAFTRRLATLSYIDRMVRPSHLILHQTHLPMITAPIVAGRHGAARTYAAMLTTWKEAMGAYKAGGKDSLQSIGDQFHQGTNYNDLMKSMFSGAKDGARLGKLFDHLSELGLIHPQAGIEVGKYAPHNQGHGLLGAVDGGLNRFDTVFRHLTSSTEAINRYVGAAMSYRLEYSKLVKSGMKSSEADALATEYARNTVANSEGYFTSSNAAPMFKNKWLRPFMQFRQFPQMMYNLLGKTMLQAFKGASTREKVEGIASLAGLLGTHTLMTGLLGGLPLESAKVVGMVTKGLGVTPGDWSDVERAAYDEAVAHFGKTGADYVMHGMSRALGVDAHHRLGLNSFFTFGMPDKLSAESVWAFLAHDAAGAPGGLAEDALKGFYKMMNGDVEGGALQAFPLQALRDWHSALAGGSKNYQYGPGEEVLRGLGFTPAGEAEHYERASEARQMVSDFTARRNGLIQKWIDAAPDQKSKAWSQIQKFNQGYPSASKITMRDLTSGLRRKQAGARGANVEGVHVSKRTQWVQDRAQSIY